MNFFLTFFLLFIAFNKSCYAGFFSKKTNESFAEMAAGHSINLPLNQPHMNAEITYITQDGKEKTVNVSFLNFNKNDEFLTSDLGSAAETFPLTSIMSIDVKGLDTMSKSGDYLNVSVRVKGVEEPTKALIEKKTTVSGFRNGVKDSIFITSLANVSKIVVTGSDNPFARQTIKSRNNVAQSIANRIKQNDQVVDTKRSGRGIIQNLIEYFKNPASRKKDSRVGLAADPSASIYG